MKAVTFAVVLMLAANLAWADRPAVVALSTMTSVTVKLTDVAKYEPGSSLSYKISHCPDGVLFKWGTVNGDAVKMDSWGLYTFSVENLAPKLWSPRTPELYEISVTDSSGRLLGKTRFGFRTFEAKGDKFYLNGRPIFLRGLPINPPGRELPAATERDPRFIRGYLKLLQSAHVNMIRTEPQDWLDACDELGMMVFTGRYGSAPGTKGPVAPPVDRTLPFYRDMVLSLASHPAVTIYVLTNEVDYESPNSTNLQLLTAVHDDIRSVDPTRPMIGNAGFGHGKPGEIFDVHAYHGWYGAGANDWYHLFSTYQGEAATAHQPLTFTECVGAYTSDAGYFSTMSKQLCTMMKWVGTAKDPRQAALDYQAELVRQIVEIARRYRTGKGSVAGMMPFTYFMGWTGAKKAEDLVIKPAFEALRTVYQPILLSPECWHRDVYAGDHLKLRLCVANDDDGGHDLGPSTALVEVLNSRGKTAASVTVGFAKTPYYSNNWRDVSLALPKTLARGWYEVRCRLMANGAEISRNSFQISVAPHAWVKARSRSVALYDPSGDTAKALKLLGVRFTGISSLEKLPQSGTVVIGEETLSAGGYPDGTAVLAFLGRGGRILCLRQNPADWSSDWLPARFKMHRRPYSYIQPVGGNATIMNGLSDRDLRFWNEIGQRANDIPRAYPAVGAFVPDSVNDLRNARVWASCDQLLGCAALLEIAHGAGSVILSQFGLVERAADDPAAAKLLTNLIAYATSSEKANPVDLSEPVIWNQAAFRSGVFVSPLQGLLPHSKTYKHQGNSKGLLEDDNRIDGFTLVGDYHFDANGWLRPVPDPKADGWGIVFGAISRPATRFVLKLHNTGDSPASIALTLDGKAVGSPQSVEPGREQILEWKVSRAAGPVKIELRGDQRLVITESRFE